AGAHAAARHRAVLRDQERHPRPRARVRSRRHRLLQLAVPADRQAGPLAHRAPVGARPLLRRLPPRLRARAPARQRRRGGGGHGGGLRSGDRAGGGGEAGQPRRAALVARDGLVQERAVPLAAPERSAGERRQAGPRGLRASRRQRRRTRRDGGRPGSAARTVAGAAGGGRDRGLPAGLPPAAWPRNAARSAGAVKPAIYLDANATTPLSREALEEMMPALGGVFANPSSVHKQGQDARAVVDKARERCARALGCAPREVIFTSGGTEADALGILGSRPERVVTTAVEHPAVLGACQAAPQQTLVPVFASGELDLDAL